MENSKREKVNKNPDKIRKDILAIVFVLLIIAGYIFYECYSATHIEVETITAVTSTVYDSVEAKALVIRDEKIINSGSGGVTVPCVADGEKIKQGGNAAMIFSSDENAKNYSVLENLHSQLDYYIDLESKSAGIATDVAAIDKDILGDINDYVRIVNSNSYSNLSACSQDLNDKFARRQIIIGEDIDFSAVKENLQSQINNIDSTACNPTGYITSEESGVFSSYTDSFENVFDYNNVSSLTPEMLKQHIESVSNADNRDANVLGKIVKSYKWYFCCVLSADDVKGIKNGDVLNVAVKDSDDVIQCDVVSGADLDLGESETVLVLSCSQVNDRILSMRLEDIEIRFNEYTGFKVPSSAIHVNEEGNKCVYALVANQVAERQGEVIYSTKDYSIFADGSKEKNSIRYYDQIITKGKDLHDGKVYS